jgi:N-acylneuraminate cytidylyltransferase
MSARRIAVIPARGGSKRIPHKNIKPFFGQPLLSYSIRAARDCGLFDHVIVSTDDEEIALAARRFGAEVPFIRPPELSGDHIGTNAVIIHAIDWFTEVAEAPDAVCCIYATAPFLTAARLSEGWQALQDKRFAFSATSYAFAIQRALYLTETGGVCMFQPEHRLTRSQDLTPAFHDAAQFYWGWAEAFKNGEEIFAPHSAPVILPRTEVVDIDTPEDWAVAEQMYAALRHPQAL